MDRDRDPVMTLHGMWRFHTGDDAAWAKPDFDDSAWPLLRSNVGWGEQGYSGYDGFAWYRFRVVLPDNQKQWAISLPRLFSSYELFADGRLIGHFGGVPPHTKYVAGFEQVFPIPRDLLSADRTTVTFAIRVWQRPGIKSVSGGPISVTHVGELEALRTEALHENLGRFWSSSSGNVMMLMNLLAALAGLFLFWMRPQDREYLWFGLYELVSGVDHLVLESYRYVPVPVTVISSLDLIFSVTSWMLFLMFIFTLLHGRRNWLFWSAVAAGVVTTLAQTALLFESISSVQYDVILASALIPYFCCILGLLYRKAVAGVPEARLLLIPVSICYACWLILIVLSGFGAAGHAWVYKDLHWYFEVSRVPFPFSVNDITDLLMLIAVVAVLPLGFARSRQDEERLEGEMASARAVQQVLIPRAIPHVPGYSIQCVYKPAGQVGGDFFQVMPLRTGGALIAVGDVSGKGMPAAMTVSLLVGTFRSLAYYTQKPTEILIAMNRRMLSRSQGGFTTCIVLRLEANGAVTIANAGHIAPYLAGEEVALQNGFPLGITNDTTYEETKIQMTPGAQLTLYTDGVVEARGKSGELLGFSRAAELSTKTAEQIAQQAQSFGQDDDITVLTLSLAPS